MKEKSVSKTVTFIGKTILRKQYTIRINIADSKVQSIDIQGEPNLFIRDICSRFERKHAANYDDVIRCVELVMRQKSEFVEERQ